MCINYVFLDEVVYKQASDESRSLLERNSHKIILSRSHAVGAKSRRTSAASAGGVIEYVDIAGMGSAASIIIPLHHFSLKQLENPAAQFHIIYEDAGLEPLMRHLRGRGIPVFRHTCISSIPAPIPGLDIKIIPRPKERLADANYRAFVFVDYENVQPNNFELLKDAPCKVMVFLGSHQEKFRCTIAKPLKDNAEFVVLDGAGRNALDYHIAYYLSRYSALYPSAQFHVISKDADFDCLIKRLGKDGIQASRSACIPSIPRLMPNPITLNPLVPDVQIEAVVANLRRRTVKPKSVPALLNTLRDFFRSRLTEQPEQQIDHLLKKLIQFGLVRVDGRKVFYGSALES